MKISEAEPGTCVEINGVIVLIENDDQGYDIVTGDYAGEHCDSVAELLENIEAELECEEVDFDLT